MRCKAFDGALNSDILIDFLRDTQPNADGILPLLMKEAGFEQVEETDVVPTLTSSLSLYRATKPSSRR